MRVIFSGGGTLGSVSPLLAVVEELRRRDSNVEFLWLGTKDGPEKILAEENKIPFKSIAAGKLRRYFSLTAVRQVLENFFDLFKIKIGFLQSFFILKKFIHSCHSEERSDEESRGSEATHGSFADRPAGSREIPRHARNDKEKAVFVSAGAFVSVPAAFAAYILKIPILIHQQDVVAGLANKIMAFFAKKITVSLDVSLGYFSKNKTELIGNPVRSFIFLGDKEKVFQKFNLKKDLPVMLVTGGGTGAEAINEMVIKSFPELVKFCQIIHLTGRNKGVAHESARQNRDERTLSCANPQHNENARYHQIEFVTSEISDFYAAADLVVSRAGMSSLSEICVLGKPAIIIPIPNSHQEKNAEYFASRGAVKIFRQPLNLSFRVMPEADPPGAEKRESSKIFLDYPIKSGNDKVDEFVNLIKELLFNPSEREKLSENAKKIMPRDAARKMAEIIQSMAK